MLRGLLPALAGACVMLALFRPYAALPSPQFVFEHARHAASYAISQAPASVFRFELRAGDCPKPKDCRTGRERAELMEIWQPPLHMTVHYRFMLMLPEDYPEMSPKQILGQWHDGTRPALSNRYENGRFWIDLMGGDSRTTHRFAVDRFQKGVWQELAYEIRWSDRSDGRLRVWHNGALIADYKGPTLSADWTRPPRFKIGIYRSHLHKRTAPAPVQVAFVAGYRRSIDDRPTTN